MFICTKCKTKTKIKNYDGTIKELIKKEKIGEGVAEKKDFSGYDFNCTKCNNKKCKVIDLRMMYGDEDWIYLLECTKCGQAQRIGECW